MRLRNSILAVSALFVCALPAVMLAVAAPAPPCRFVDADLTSDTDLAALIDNGWAGDPSDGIERLYSPTCDR